MRALVIEDDPITAMMIGDELRDLGYSSIDTAATEEEAVISVANRRPQLITCDGCLSGGSGVGAFQRIRRSSLVPVIFITGDPEHARRSIADAPILSKPFSILKLVEAVEQVRLAEPLHR